MRIAQSLAENKAKGRKGRRKLPPKRIKKEEKSLRHYLHRELSGAQKARGTKIVHASEMLKSGMYGQDLQFCPREFALLDHTGKTRDDEHVNTSSRVTWNLGDAVADMIVQTFANMGKAVGDWKCPHCKEEYKFQKRPEECKGCGHERFDYVECRFFSKETEQSCGVDLLVDDGSGLLTLVELKSIKDSKFKELAGPLAEHKYRTNLYMRIVEDSDCGRGKEINTDEAKVLYMTKGGFGCKDETLHKEEIIDGPFSPFKEFSVLRDDDQTQEKWDHARRLFEFRKGEKGFPLGLCKTRMANRAQKCPVVDECFSGRYTGEV